MEDDTFLLIKKIYDDEFSTLSEEEKKIRKHDEQLLSIYTGKIIKYYYPEIEYVSCDVMLSRSVTNFYEERFRERKLVFGFYITNRDTIVLPPYFRLLWFFHEVVHHMQFLRANRVKELAFKRDYEKEADKLAEKIYKKFAKDITNELMFLEPIMHQTLKV